MILMTGEFSFVIGNWTGQFDELITSELYNLSFYLVQIKMMKLTLIQVLFQKRVQAEWFYCFERLET